jgi:hypothetical protein
LNDIFIGGPVVNVHRFGGIFRPNLVEGVLFGLFQHGDILPRMEFAVNVKKKSGPKTALGALPPSTIWYRYQIVRTSP